MEPEVDLSAFLEKQRIASPQLESSAPLAPEEDDDIDKTLVHLPGIKKESSSNDRKGKIQQVEWDQSLEELSREKAAADATRGTSSTLSTGRYALLKS